MTILVNGASISAVPNSWPVHLQTRLGRKIVNLSMPACGYTYVQETTIEYIANNHVDLVLIMWPEVISRIDYKVNIVNKESPWSSFHLGNIHDTHAGVDRTQLNPNPHIPRDWIHSQGYLESVANRTEPDPVSQVFHDHYQVTKYAQLVYHGIIRMISLQGVLTSMNIPYVFMTLHPIKQQVRYAHLYKLLNFDNFYTDVYLYNLCKENNWLDPNNMNYPTTTGFGEFVDLLTEHLKKKSYV